MSNARSLARRKIWADPAKRIRYMGGMNPDKETNPIKKLRIALGLNQSEFAKKLGMSVGSGPSISEWENGKTPTPKKVAKMRALAMENDLEFKYNPLKDASL